MILINESTRESALYWANHIAAHPEIWKNRIAKNWGINPDRIVGIAVGIQNGTDPRITFNDIECIIVKVKNEEDGTVKVRIVEYFHNDTLGNGYTSEHDYASVLKHLRRNYGVDSVAIAFDP